jgi:hypothetical protein
LRGVSAKSKAIHRKGRRDRKVEKGLPRINTDDTDKLFTAKDAQPPQQAKTGLAGDPGLAKESKANRAGESNIAPELSNGNRGCDAEIVL